MSNATPRLSRGQPGVDPDDSENDAISASELFELLNDEYTREFLVELRAGAKSARRLATECDVSRATVYRRLNRLEEMGLVTCGMHLDPDGHHRKRYRSRFERATFSLSDSEGVSTDEVVMTHTDEDDSTTQW